MYQLLSDHKISLDYLLKEHKRLCDKARLLVKIKGEDYNAKQQLQGDTLFNLRVPSLLGLTDHPAKNCLINASNKIMRLSSLVDKDPSVKGETFEDSVVDNINYTIYAEVFFEEGKRLIKVSKRK